MLPGATVSPDHLSSDFKALSNSSEERYKISGAPGRLKSKPAGLAGRFRSQQHPSIFKRSPSPLVLIHITDRLHFWAVMTT